MFSGIYDQKTGPLQNTQPTLNMLISSSDVAVYDKSAAGLQYRPVATKLVRADTARTNIPGMLVTTKFNSEHIAIGIAHGRGSVAANSNYNDIAVVTAGPGTIQMDAVKKDGDEVLVPGMLLYPISESGTLCVATERHLKKANWAAQSAAIVAAAANIGNSNDATSAATNIISAYHTLVKPFAMVVECKKGSSYVNVLLGPY